MRITKRRLGEARQLSGGGGGVGVSCLTSAGRVTLAGGTNVSHINTLACLPGTTFCVPGKNKWKLNIKINRNCVDEVEQKLQRIYVV